MSCFLSSLIIPVFSYFMSQPVCILHLCIQIVVFIYIISLILLGIRFGLVHTLRTEHS